MLSPGDKLKDYEVIAPLTSGGMATLFLARRRGVGGFSRLVALKLVHQHLTDDSAMIKLFLDEARISAHVVHPNVVHVEEVGMEQGAYFIAMEYVHGVSLAQLLKRLADERRRFSPKLCVWLAAQIAEALHAAHEATGEQGQSLHIVHRDVSPQNALIGHTGHVKLIDFGIAKSHAALHKSEGGAGVLGKLRYMSPEQLLLNPIDRRTDIYALGVMLWEMLTARSLFRCQRIDDPRDWAIREDPPPPSKYTPLSTSQLDRAVLKAISLDQNDRFETALQFRSALLRAEPAAARIDAPKIAAVLRALLGDELDRKRANLPNEITAQLEIDAAAPRELPELSELTSDIGAPSIEAAIDEDSAPTRIKSSFDLDSRLESRASIERTRTPRYPAAALPARSMSPEAAQAIARIRRAATTGVVAVGAVCLSIGLLIGRGTSSPTTHAEPLDNPAPQMAAAPAERVAAPALPEPRPPAEQSPLTSKPIEPVIDAGEPAKTAAETIAQPEREAATNAASAESKGERTPPKAIASAKKRVMRKRGTAQKARLAKSVSTIK